MQKQKSLKLNFLMNAALTMSSFIFPLITFPYVSRILLPTGTGKVSFATSVIYYFSMFAQLGIPTYGIRACAKVRDDKEKLSRTVQEIFIINIIMSCAVYLVFFIALSFVPRLRQDKDLFIIVSATILFNAIGMEWVYKALEQYTYITVRSITFKFIALLAMFAFIHQQSDYVIYGGISIFASVGSNIFNFINIKKYINIKPVGNYEFKKHLKAVGIFFAMSVATTIYTHMDTVMLGFMTTDQDVGYYNAAVKIKTILVGFITSLGAVLLPRVSYYVELGLNDEFIRITKKTLNFVILLATPLVIYFITFARYGILFLSGSAYEQSILPMQIIMPTLLLIGMTNVFGIQMLVPLGKEKKVLYSEIAGAIINIILNSIFIPIFHASGAAIGTVVAEIIVFIVQFYEIKDIVWSILKKVRYGAIAASIFAALATSIWVMKFNLSNFVTLATSAVLYFGIYIVMLNIFKESLVKEIESQVIGRIMKNKKTSIGSSSN